MNKVAAEYYITSVLTAGSLFVAVHAYFCHRVRAHASVLEYVLVALLWPVYLSQLILVGLYRADKRWED